ncbi:FecR family protein [Opitutales bacterium]|nr:FecR family protein [Opitutales bacterium]
MKSSGKQMERVGLYLSGEISKEGMLQLEKDMLADSQLFKDFIAYARIDSTLSAIVSENTSLSEFVQETKTKKSLILWMPAIAAILAVMIWISSFTLSTEKPLQVARFDHLEDCRWINQQFRPGLGDPIRTGQRIELSKGYAKLRFNTGALVELTGPSILEVKGENAVFLTLGSAEVLAESKESQGFTLGTPSSKFVDLGTAFSATVAPDGLSRLEVSQGKVNLVVEDDHDIHLLQKGEAIFVEPGSHKILTRIESGDGTEQFRFPTIAPPSNDDLADQSRGGARITVPQGKLMTPRSSTPNPSVLIDGRGQSKQDSPRESLFFENGRYGSLLMDLGRAVSIRKINSYSWHQHNRIEDHRVRAHQGYVLYGFAGETPPSAEAVGDPDSGWVRIARVNSDQFFQVHQKLDRPAQQACSIFASKGELGKYRYLLWDVKAPTFFGEIDVYETP